MRDDGDEERVVKKGRKKAAPYDPVENSRHRKHPKADAIAAKIGMLIEAEGKTAAQAAGQAYGMARGGLLGKAAKRKAGKRKKA